MSDKPKYVAGRPGWGEEHIHLWQLREMIKVAERANMSDLSQVKLTHDPNYLTDRISIVDDRTGRCIHPEPNPLVPVAPEPDPAPEVPRYLYHRCDSGNVNQELEYYRNRGYDLVSLVRTLQTVDIVFRKVA